jgi:hypothetical protein
MATYCNQLLLPKYWMLCEEKACQAWKPQTSRRQQGDQKLSCWAMCLDSSAPFKHAVPVPLFQDATGVAWTWNARSAKFPAFRRFGKNDAGHFDSTLAAYHFQTHASTFFEPSIRMSEPMVFIWSLFARERERALVRFQFQDLWMLYVEERIAKLEKKNDTLSHCLSFVYVFRWSALWQHRSMAAGRGSSTFGSG